jgi:hypothetical protein
VTRKINIDGTGHAGTGVLKAITRMRWPDNQFPHVALRDFGKWRNLHAEARLVGTSDLERWKVETGVRMLRQAGWPEQLIHRYVGDVRGCPRGSYEGSVTLALTDSHESKHASVSKALQVGSPAIAIGLGRREATVEFYEPGGAYYCCVHGPDPEWAQRHPCPVRPSASTTQITANSRSIVARACRLAARVATRYLATCRFPGNRGVHLHGGGVGWFEFHREASCEGPHDERFTPRGASTVVVPGRPEEHHLQELLDRAGVGACYDDREIAWNWYCPACRSCHRGVHVVHPAAACASCGNVLAVGSHRASGLTGEQLRFLNGDRPVTLGTMGLADETILRLAGSQGELIWMYLQGEEP